MGVCIRPKADRCLLLDERGPEGGRAVRLHLSAKGGFHQDGMKYVDEEPYRMSAWVRTKNLKPGTVALIVYDDWLHINKKSEPFPADTGGKWVKVSTKGSDPSISTKGSDPSIEDVLYMIGG